jgi:ribosomal protein L39E
MYTTCNLAERRKQNRRIAYEVRYTTGRKVKNKEG